MRIKVFKTAVKAFIVLSLTIMTVTNRAFAEPAHPQPVTVMQPDGSTLTLKLVGDEFYHFNTTTDGYTLLKDKGGY